MMNKFNLPYIGICYTLSSGWNLLDLGIILENEAGNSLIDAIYNVTIDPDKYDELLHLWESEFLEISNENKYLDRISENSKHISYAIESHFFRAYAILEKVGNQVATIPTIKQLVEADPLPAFLVSKDRNILLSNCASEQLMKISSNSQFCDLPFSKNDFEKIETLLGKLDHKQGERILALIYSAPKDDTSPILFALSKPNGHDLSDQVIQFTTVQTTWNKNVGVAIQDVFELTDTELDLAKRLVKGHKLAYIAETKNRSINTIRTQSKVLYSKTKLRTQGELIGLFAAIQGRQQPKIDVEKHTPELTPQNKFITKTDGRKIYYEIYGDPIGRPILFMHGAITGTKLPQIVTNYLVDNRLKIISPHRASYGKSQAYHGKDILANFVNDISFVLAAEKILNFSVLGHHGGSYYAYLLGQKLSEQVDKITIINGAVPFKSAKQINEMNRRQRIITYTARYAPNLLPFLLRGAIAEIAQNNANNMLNELFKNSEFDMALCQTPETRNIIKDGILSSLAQGVGSFKNDAYFICRGNWQDLILNCPVPIEVYHATNDPAVPIKHVIQQFKSCPDIKLNVIDGGQMILYKYPEKLLMNI